jgi:ketosteroid isomerase-like protein
VPGEAGLIGRVKIYSDIDEARAAAEQLAKERRWRMPEEHATPDLEERGQRFGQALSRGDVDAVAAMFAPDAVWITSDFEGLFEGREAIRSLIDDFVRPFEDLEQETREFRYLGGGATFSVVVQRGRPINSIVVVERRVAAIVVWADGLIERLTTYADIDEARAAAERLAGERAKAVSEENS